LGKDKECLIQKILKLCGVEGRERMTEVNIHVTPKEFQIEVTHNAMGIDGQSSRVEDGALVQYTKKYKLVEVFDSEDG